MPALLGFAAFLMTVAGVTLILLICWTRPRE